MTSRITRLQHPIFFQDRMVSGPFASFEHDHRFEEAGGVTSMYDEIRFQSPLGVIGTLADRAIIGRHLERFLLARNNQLKSVAESDDLWQHYTDH